MQRTRNSLRKPAVILLIGIVLIALSFAFLYFVVPPIVSLNTYSVSQATVTKTIFNGSSLSLHFGRPVDSSMNLTLVLGTNETTNVTVYIGDSLVFNFNQPNATQHNLEFNSTKYMLFVNNKTTPPTWLHPGIYCSIPFSLGYAFTGGTTPYLMITNPNTTESTKVTYSYTYSAKFIHSDGIPLLLFIVGVIIVIVYGIAFVRRLIKSVRKS